MCMAERGALCLTLCIALRRTAATCNILQHIVLHLNTLAAAHTNIYMYI